MKKRLIALSVALLVPFASSAFAAETIKRVSKQQPGVKTLESRQKATQEREARKLQQEKARKLQKKQDEKEKAERKRKIEAERKAAKAQKTASKQSVKTQPIKKK